MSDILKGIDVSKHQGDIDWEKVKNSGVKFGDSFITSPAFFIFLISSIHSSFLFSSTHSILLSIQIY